MAVQDNRYGAFSFMVALGDPGDEDQIAGGFSYFSGAGSEDEVAGCRNGKDMDHHVREAAKTNESFDVTLKRGIVGDRRLIGWLKETRKGKHAARTVTVTWLDEERAPACKWILHSVVPMKYVGPTLAAEGGGDVVIEEIQLVADGIDFVST